MLRDYRGSALQCHTMNGSVAPDQAPDWQQLDVAVHCPRCGYNLYLMTTPRCPECGLRFDWDQVIASARHPKFPPFEYKWRTRPIRALLATVAYTLLPWLLWKRARTSAAPRTGPLLALIPLTLLLFAAARAVGLITRQWVLHYCFQWWDNLSIHLMLVLIGWEWFFFLLFGAALWGWTLLLPYTLAPRQLPRARMLRIVVLSWISLVVWRVLLLIAIHLTLVVVVGLYQMRWPAWTINLLELIPIAMLLISFHIGMLSYQRPRQALVTTLLITTLALFVVVWCTIMIGPLSPIGHPIMDVVSAAERLWPFATENVLDVLRRTIIGTG